MRYLDWAFCLQSSVFTTKTRRFNRSKTSFGSPFIFHSALLILVIPLSPFHGGNESISMTITRSSTSEETGKTFSLSRAHQLALRLSFLSFTLMLSSSPPLYFRSSSGLLHLAPDSFFRVAFLIWELLRSLLFSTRQAFLFCCFLK
jgi:hypothetical protein